MHGDSIDIDTASQNVQNPMNRQKLPILMTASVSTRGMKGACFAPEEREYMYINTMCFYRDEILRKDQERRIVFVENSGWNLKNIISCVDGFHDQVEFISLPPEDFEISKGKGYNEILMINAALEKSRFIKEAGVFLKVTGRYPFYNIRFFIDSAETFFMDSGGQFYGNMKDHCLYDALFPGKRDKWNGHAAGTSLFATTIGFYKDVLAASYAQCDDSAGRFVECVWYDILVPYRHANDGRVSLRFRKAPVCGGVQGSQRQSFMARSRNDGFRSRVFRGVDSFLRTFAPWFWF